DYILNELPRLIEKHFPTNGKRSIMGHSMGGHGALVLALRNQERYQSVSAFSPILSPSLVPWGEKAFTAYLGKDREKWQQYDANSLIQQGYKVQGMRIDQGLEDEF
ncbi:alpha/beta hydrolase, partial [Enterobacter hormaechei subsp. steigerwaltii]|nr:alpha/beta hydrolase [Enterobacter hormaechei subsp. steigerwaltii]